MIAKSIDSLVQEDTHLLNQSTNHPPKKKSSSSLRSFGNPLPPQNAPEPTVLAGHLESLNRLASQLQTDFKTGLPRTILAQRRAQFGSNRIELPHGATFRIFRGWLKPDWGLALSKLCEQFMNPLIGLLVASALVSLFLLKQVENAISIGVAVAIVGFVGFFQEFRTEKSLEALQKLAPPRCRVIRDGGRAWEVEAAELVVGDVVELQMGDRVPADLYLITANDVQVDESMLTGETKPVKKLSFSNAGENQNKQSTVFMGTLVRQGRARGVVMAVGLKTEFGRLASMMQEVEERRSPLQVRLDGLGHQLTLYSVLVIVAISLIGWLGQGRPFMEIFTVAVSLAVAAIPEGLPIVATITLALGVLRLAKRGVVVKKLPAVEALGSMSVLCADKTGTLTLNQMTVEEVFTLDESGNLTATKIV